MPASFVNGPRPVMGYEAISVSTTAVGPTAATIRTVTAQNSSASGSLGNPDMIAEYAVEAFVTVETNSMRYRIDGTSPTASEGHVLAASDTLTVQGYQNIKNLKLIRVSADGTARVTYFK